MGMSNLDGYHPNKNESYQLGYQQGRADAFKEIAYSDDVKKEEFEILAYEKGRADERAKVLKEVHLFFVEEMDRLETDYDGIDEFYSDTKKVNEILSLNKRLCERLKEQK